MNTSNFGSLALAPKHDRAWGDDGTTTRAGKAVAMVNGIDLRSPAADSMREHERHVRWIVYAAWTTAVIAVATLALRWMTL